MQYKEKTVWITGACSGIGEALAIGFAKKGANIVLSSPNKIKLEEVQEKCKSYNSKCIVLPLDLTKQEEFQALVQQVISEFKVIDLLINNAGISQRSYIAETPLEIDRKVFEINFFGTIALTKAVLPVMLKQKSGQIATVTSIVGKFGFPLRSAYSASKHALHGFFETLLLENFRNGIKVSMIIPGRVKTAISQNAITSDGSAHAKLDDGQNSGITTELAATRIIRGLEKEKYEILIGGKELLMLRIKKYIPVLFRRIASKIQST